MVRATPPAINRQGTSLTPLQQRVLDILAERLRTGQQRYVDGVILRQQLPSGSRSTKTQAIHGVVPSYVRATGEDRYAVTWPGVMRSKQQKWFAQAAKALHAFLRKTFAANPDFQSFTWEAVVADVSVAGSPLQSEDLEAVEFVLMNLGAWGRSGTTFSRPPGPQLEDILEVDDTAAEVHPLSWTPQNAQ